MSSYWNSYKRVDSTHPLDLYIGKNIHGSDSLLFIFSNRPSRGDLTLLRSSAAIDMQIRIREDGRYALDASLIDYSFEEPFRSFVDDIVESSRSITNPDDGIGFLAQRYSKWQGLFEKMGSNLLSVQEMKGLIGELFFLDKHMIPAYGIEKSIEAWTGCMGADQDFRIDDVWYEIKATSVSASTLKISSVEQLDSPDTGYLYVIGMDMTSSADDEALSLNSMVQKLFSLMDDSSIRNSFMDKLLMCGYCQRDEYDLYYYKIEKVRSFRVDDDFPALRRKDIRFPEITNAVYTLDISGLEECGLMGGCNNE